MKRWATLFCCFLLALNDVKAQDEPVQWINPDTVIAVASTAYSGETVVTRFLMGKNYRSIWDTPVRFPVFCLSKSGFTIERAGGSKQTNSLYLTDSSGNSWVLRSVDKDVRRGYPDFFFMAPVIAFKQDLVSANHPYGALVAAAVMKAASVPAPDPVYYYVADDTALGEARIIFGNTVCMLEKRDPTCNSATSIPTDSLKIILQSDTTCHIQKKKLLEVRMLDMLIGDCDRHEGQFRWGQLDSGLAKYYYPIPRDRDFVIFSSGGLLPLLLEGLTGRPRIRFTPSSKNLARLNHKAWEFDKEFLAGLTRQEWQLTAQSILNEMTDEVLDEAARKLPPEIYSINGTETATKLKSRKQDFISHVMEYYSFLFPEPR